MVLDALLDTLIDGVKLLPFLFLTYLLMEYLEHKASEKTVSWIRKSGKWGPVLGGVLGVFPQCGFSAAGASLYAGRIITRGTLLAIFFSTSDEMLPIMISEKMNPVLIFKILGIKMVLGILFGFLIDCIQTLMKKQKESMRIEHLCDHEHCHCDEGKILKSAFVHTLQVFAYIIIFSFLVNLCIGFLGQDRLSEILMTQKVLSVFIAGFIGLVPNCASSVVITELYVDGLLSFGAMMAGLLVGSGIGLLVLFRVNDDLKDSMKVALILYLVGVAAGLTLLKF